jgi:hypothetical protein
MTSVIQQKPVELYMEHTPNTAREGNQHAECPCIVLRAVLGVEPFKNADHYSEDQNLAGGTYRKRDVGYAIAVE